jgi:hypothetical protein
VKITAEALKGAKLAPVGARKAVATPPERKETPPPRESPTPKQTSEPTNKPDLRPLPKPVPKGTLSHRVSLFMKCLSFSDVTDVSFFIEMLLLI